MWKCFSIAVASMSALLAQNRPAQVVSVPFTSRFNAAAHIRVENSFGQVDIAGWDQPQVELTVSRSTQRYYDPQDQTAARRRLDSVKVEAKQEGNDLVISTVYPPRNFFLHQLSRRSDVDIRYEIHAPRNSHLTIHHNSGGVHVSGIYGPIRATVANGQITLTLPPGPYDIDARSSLGKVYSDFEGKERTRRLFGEEFKRPPASSASNLYLRVRIGDIVLFERAGPDD